MGKDVARKYDITDFIDLLNMILNEVKDGELYTRSMLLGCTSKFFKETEMYKKYKNLFGPNDFEDYEGKLIEIEVNNYGIESICINEKVFDSLDARGLGRAIAVNDVFDVIALTVSTDIIADYGASVFDVYGMEHFKFCFIELGNKSFDMNLGVLSSPAYVFKWILKDLREYLFTSSHNILYFNGRIPFTTSNFYVLKSWELGMKHLGVYIQCDPDSDYNLADFLCYNFAYLQKEIHTQKIESWTIEFYNLYKLYASNIEFTNFKNMFKSQGKFGNFKNLCIKHNVKIIINNIVDEQLEQLQKLFTDVLGDIVEYRDEDVDLSMYIKGCVYRVAKIDDDTDNDLYDLLIDENRDTN